MFYFMVFLISITNSCSSLQLNIYTSIGQIQQEVVIENGYFQIHFTEQEYQLIVPGTIDFPDQQLVERDFYSSNEELRDSTIFLGSNGCSVIESRQATLVDPHTFLIKSESSRYSYVSRDNIEFKQDPVLNGMILAVRFENSSATRATFTYLTRGLFWTPRYDVVILNEHSATLRALADINNDHRRSYQVDQSQLITGTIPIIMSQTVRSSTTPENQRAEFVSSTVEDTYASITNRPDSNNLGSYSYNITRSFQLRSKSIKSFPFLTTKIHFNSSLEASTYLSNGLSLGIFQRIFVIQPTEFLPAGVITFYLASNSVTLGQARIPDTPGKTEQKINLGNDPDVRYQIVSIVTATRQMPTYGQDVNVNITITNRKEQQAIRGTLTINSGYRNTTSLTKIRASSNIEISLDPNNRAIFTIRASVKPNQEETCSFAVKLSN